MDTNADPRILTGIFVVLGVFFITAVMPDLAIWARKRKEKIPATAKTIFEKAKALYNNVMLAILGGGASKRINHL